MRTRPSRIHAALIVPLAALATLTGCGSALDTDIHPGAAAVVGDRSISISEVDDFADEYCSLFGLVLQQRGEKVPLGQIRTFAVTSILEDELVHRFAEEEGLEPPPAYRQRLGVLEAEARELNIPPKDVGTYVELSTRDAYAQSIKAQAGADALEEAGEAVEPEAAAQRGKEVYSAWRDGVEVSVDPRFGTMDEDFTYIPGSVSLSTPVSELARGAYAQNPDPGYVNTLPASQTCG